MSKDVIRNDHGSEQTVVEPLSYLSGRTLKPKPQGRTREQFQASEQRETGIQFDTASNGLGSRYVNRASNNQPFSTNEYRLKGSDVTKEDAPRFSMNADTAPNTNLSRNEKVNSNQLVEWYDLTGTLDCAVSITYQRAP
jgi:hypothetical protein